MSEKRVRLVVEGKVQGVYFRQSTSEEAAALGLRGWVKNRPDGAVEVLAEGSPEAIGRLVAWALEGPPAARVDRLTVVVEATASDLGPFAVQR